MCGFMTGRNFINEKSGSKGYGRKKNGGKIGLNNYIKMKTQ